MSLIELQKALLTLYTDADAYQEYKNDRDVFLNQYDLTDRECSSIKNIPERKFHMFVGQLHTKRNRINNKIMRGGRSMVLLPYSDHHAPLLQWGPKDEEHIKISKNMFRFLKDLGEGGDQLTLGRILDEYAKTPYKVGMGQLFVLVKTLYAHNLIGRYIIPR